MRCPAENGIKMDCEMPARCLNRMSQMRSLMARMMMWSARCLSDDPVFEMKEKEKRYVKCPTEIRSVSYPTVSGLDWAQSKGRLSPGCRWPP